MPTPPHYRIPPLLFEDLHLAVLAHTRDASAVCKPDILERDVLPAFRTAFEILGLAVCIMHHKFHYRRDSRTHSVHLHHLAAPHLGKSRLLGVMARSMAGIGEVAQTGQTYLCHFWSVANVSR